MINSARALSIFSLLLNGEVACTNIPHIKMLSNSVFLVSLNMQLTDHNQTKLSHLLCHQNQLENAQFLFSWKTTLSESLSD